MDDYNEPSSNEEYMSPRQLAYFKNKLLDWKRELNQELIQTMHHLREERWNEPDITDRANIEMDIGLELKTRSRIKKLIEKIDISLSKIQDGSYGFCEDTGEPIGVKRLEARPIATLTIEAQERHERFERDHSKE